MVNRNGTGDLYDPRSGGQAIRIERLRLDGRPCEPARTNYFAVYLIESGSGTFWADASRFAFGPDSLLFFVPYQHIRFVPDVPGPRRGRPVPRQLPLRRDVPRRGRLQRRPVQRPLRHPRGRAGRTGEGGSDRPDRPHPARSTPRRDLAYGEVMLAYLKVLLILATRLKSPRAGACGPGRPTSGIRSWPSCVT